MSDLVHSIGALARRVHLPAPWIRERIASGELPCLIVGRSRVFSVSAVEAALGQMAGRASPKCLELRTETQVQEARNGAS